MRGLLPLVAVLSALGAASGEAAPLTLRTAGCTALFSRGALVSLKDAQGRFLVNGQSGVPGMAIYRIAAEHRAAAEVGPAGRISAFTDLPGAEALFTARADGQTGDVLVEQSAMSPEKGVWGVGWAVDGIPLRTNLLVPAHSGLRLSSASPGKAFTFDYPMGWEAQLVVAEGKGAGFAVWAEDATCRFKRLVVLRGEKSWRLEFITLNEAPFDALQSCRSVRWRVSLYR
ncbi:MAG: hypothetical protein QHJ73_12170, partial [Armatimonadota bacterium]|nr:hypothetical protein [Armatimonadota bacterium]